MMARLASALGRARPRRLRLATLVLLLSTQAAAVALGSVAHEVLQRGRAFSLAQIAIAPGETLQFDNDDQFLHQIYVNSPELTFESDEQPPGEAVRVTFPTAGTYEVHCHIHPKMGLLVRVE
jgi:plastocyanin